MKYLIKNTFIAFIIVIGFIACNETSKKESEGQSKKQEETTKINDQELARIDALNKKIREDSLNGDSYRDRAGFYLEKEEYRKALEDIRKSIIIDSAYSPYYVTLGEIFLGMGRFKNCVESFDRAIKLDPNNKEAYLKLAEISIAVNDSKKALGYIDKVMKIDDLEPKAYFMRGIVMLQIGDTVHGVRNFQKAIDVDQGFFDAHLKLGLLYLGKKNKLAVDYLNNALNISPGNPEVTYYLGMYYQETGNYEKAVQIYNTILENKPDFYFALYNLGFINLVYLKDYPVAIDYFNKTIEQNPQYTDAFYNRGFAYELSGDIQHSKSDYKKALELVPNYEKAIEGMNRIDELEGK
ncbi:MAG: tetratricopeptide repeat protein [Chlorobi bacterium]|nr:tetratricopeptide repeat protein [Chlorobiota bacterium]